VHERHAGQKTAVIPQLGEALERVEAHDADAWMRSAARLRELRDELNAYVST
jgi:hypothetical protein